MDYFTTRSKALLLKFPIKNFVNPERFQEHRYYNPGNIMGCAYAPISVYPRELVLNPRRLEEICNHFESNANFYDVGVQGLATNTEIGSKRITAYDEGFAKYLTRLLTPHLTPEILDEYSPVDWQSDNPDGLNYWVPLGVSTIFRYMRYGHGGQHYTHYDAPFVHEDPTIRTLKSGVLYLSNSSSCRTVFVNDGQGHLPFSERRHLDWDRETYDREYVFSSMSEAGKILLFHHQIPHMVTKHTGDNDRIIIRFDVTYKAVGRID